MDKKKRKENKKKKYPSPGNTAKKRKSVEMLYHSTMRKREKAGNRDKERTCMCVFACACGTEGRRCVWGGTFEISI